MKKVSILTPCYNSAAYIHKLLDSILKQTYSNIEMFVINDGSTDNSEDIVRSYIPKFASRKISLKCINQTNQGQASAINNGLKLITGEYLVWPDSDDFYASNEAIAKMVAVLDEKPDFAVVRTFANVLEEGTLEKIGEHGGEKFIKNRKTDLFYDCLFVANNFWYGAGDYMIRVDMLKHTYPNLNFFVPSKYGGQNWQLLLPLLYKQKCFTVEEFLYNIVDRKLSHSRGHFKSLNDIIKRNEEYEKTILETLKRMNLPASELEVFSKDINIKYRLNKIDTLLQYGQKVKAKKELVELTNKYDNIPFKNQIKRIRIRMLPFFNTAKRVLRYILKIIR